MDFSSRNRNILPAGLLFRNLVVFPYLPLPGGQAVMILLTINLICGGIIKLLPRLRHRQLNSSYQSSLILLHTGIIGLLVSGAVTHHIADEGSVMLYEGQQTAGFDDYNRWQLHVLVEEPQVDNPNNVRSWAVPLADLPAGSSIDLPAIDLRITLEKQANHAMWVATESIAIDDPQVYLRLPAMALYGGLPPREEEAPTPAVSVRAVTLSDGRDLNPASVGCCCLGR